MAVSLCESLTTRMRDGRIVGYGRWGDEDGPLVLGFHGGGLCRLAHYGDEAPARAGVALVMPDRPGFGLSDANPEGTLLDWARDVGELADQLGARRFAVFGVSAGGPGAVACGYLLPERVAAVALVSAVGPYLDEPELGPFLDEKRRALVERARSDPEAALSQIRAECEREVELLAQTPELILDEWPPGTPESDRQTISAPEIRRRFLAAFRESASRGPSGCVHETLLNYARPWGFSVGHVRVPVHIWHGAQDTFVPVEVARLLARRIEGARLHVFEGEGHAVDYRHIDEILATLASAFNGR
jgi:pimeloyl-ACP methyl ester carboxylesterase